jgi:hypothetical protein
VLSLGAPGVVNPALRRKKKKLYLEIGFGSTSNVAFSDVSAALVMLSSMEPLLFARGMLSIDDILKNMVVHEIEKSNDCLREIKCVCS